ncbi:MAG: GHKL domain-containing protein, partial [Candidatus Weimeria sp.]
HLNSMFKQQQKRVHEYRHELNYLSTLLTEKAYARASNYVYELTLKSNKEDNVINTGSLVIDSILNDMYHSGIKAGIQFILKLDDLSKVNIPDEDLVVSISNLVQNALQDEIHEPVKEIKLYCQDKTGCLMFSIQNRISENDHQPRNGLDITHGYGLINAREIADKYNGSFTTGINNGWYESSIIIPYH